jgi:hypothetical protein
MSTTTNKSGTDTHGKFALWTALVIALILVALLSVEYTKLKLDISYANEQIAIFVASKNSSASMTNPKKLAGLLDYLVRYYPSGTKQEKGTQLDRIVEEMRFIVIASIISRLRTTTGVDHGNDPQLWIDEYL